jgi:hypothetical protein
MRSKTGSHYFAITCIGVTNIHFGFLVVADREPTRAQLILAGAPAYLESTEITYEVTKIGHELSRFLEATDNFRWLKLPRKTR